MVHLGDEGTNLDAIRSAVEEAGYRVPDRENTAQKMWLTLAAFDLLPPVLAAAAQSIPDLGSLVNSSRLLRE